MSEKLENNAPKSTVPYGLVGVLVLAVVFAFVVIMLVVTRNDVTETAAPADLPPVAVQGINVFNQNNCNSCHPSQGRAGGVGPRLSTTNLGDETIKNIVRKGRGSMPPYPQISDEQLNQLITYIRAIKPQS